MRIKGRSETGHFLPVLQLLGKKVVGRQPLMLLNRRTITEAPEIGQLGPAIMDNCRPLISRTFGGTAGLHLWTIVDPWRTQTSETLNR